MIGIPTNLFETFLKSFATLQGSVKDDFCTDYFEINFEITEKGTVNIET